MTEAQHQAPDSAPDSECLTLTPIVREARPQQAQYEVDLSSIPMELDGMQGQVLPEDEGVQTCLEADLIRTIACGEPPNSVTASVIYGASWRTVHSPAQCYPAAGWQVVWECDAVVPIESDLPHPKPLLGRLMRVELGDAAQMVLFIFAHKGGTSIDYTEHAWALQTGPRGAGGLSLMLSTGLRGRRHRPGTPAGDCAQRLSPRDRILVRRSGTH